MMNQACRWGIVMASDGNQQPNREQLLQMAINSAKSGNRDGARMMLRQVLSEDKRNERAMMWPHVNPLTAERSLALRSLRGLL